QVEPDLVVLLRRAKLNNPVQCVIGVVGVQGCQAQVPCFRKLHGVFHGLTGTHLADQDDVRSLPERVLQGDLKVLSINAHLTLGDNTTLGLVYKFEGSFNGEDMPATAPVTSAKQGS